jgi:hypothetical protein
MDDPTGRKGLSPYPEINRKESISRVELEAAKI